MIKIDIFTAMITSNIREKRILTEMTGVPPSE
jgi:hypothetical protein